MTEKSKKAEIPTDKKQGESNVIDMVQNNIDKQIEKFNLLQEKLNHRNKFLSTRDKLNLVEKSISDNELKSDFVTDQITLSLSGKINGYREDEVLKISIVPMIREFITFMNQKIDIKVKELEAEIIAAN